MQNFAAQAVIAIENTRLLSELRARTSELTRSVEELRALGEVSQAVNSTLDLQTVLDTIVATATQISGTEFGRYLRLRADEERIPAQRHFRHEREDDRGDARHACRDFRRGRPAHPDTRSKPDAGPARAGGNAGERHHPARRLPGAAAGAAPRFPTGWSAR